MGCKNVKMFATFLEVNQACTISLVFSFETKQNWEAKKFPMATSLNYLLVELVTFLVLAFQSL